MTETLGQVTYRAMQWWDIDTVLGIEQQLFDHDPWTAEMFWSELAEVPETRELWVAECAHVIAGYGSLRFVGSEGDINTIAVSATEQRQGIGQGLYDLMEKSAREHGVRNLFLEVRSDNEPAQAMYAKAGFEQIEIRKGYYASGVDALVMRKRLTHD